MRWDGLFLFVLDTKMISWNYTYENFLVILHDNWHGLSATKIPVIIHEMYIYITIKDTQVQLFFFHDHLVLMFCRLRIFTSILTHWKPFRIHQYRIGDVCIENCISCLFHAVHSARKYTPETLAWATAVSVLQLRENFHKIKISVYKKNVYAIEFC